MSKTTVVYHSADYDGIFCREIARKFLPDAELIGWDFADKPLVIPDGRIYILDLPVDKVFGYEIPQSITLRNVIWIDHHKSAIESHPNELPGYRIDGVAACRLAWQWFTNGPDRRREPEWDAWHNGQPTRESFVRREVEEPLAVRLAGEYDIWDKRDPRAEVFQFGLRSRELTDHDWNALLSTERPTIDQIEAMAVAGLQNVLAPDGTVTPILVAMLLRDGELLQRYQQRNDASIMHRSFLIEWEGLRFLALNTARCNSLTFASKDIPETGHDALMGFYFNGRKWTASLYHAKHRTDLDLSQIAVKYGGGGHRGACGFTCDTCEDFIEQSVSAVASRNQNYEQAN